MRSTWKHIEKSIWAFFFFIIISLPFHHRHGLSGQQEPWEVANSAGMRAYSQGQYELAQKFFLEALGYLTVQEKPDPRWAITLNNIGAVHEGLGEYEEAELRYRHSLAIVEKIQGPNHPDIVLGLNNLASLYTNQGKLEQAEPLRRRSLTILEHALGPKDPHLVQPLTALAILLQRQTKYEEAELLYQRTIRIIKENLGHHHPQLAKTLELYSTLLQETNRVEEARMIEHQIDSIRNQDSVTQP